MMFFKISSSERMTAGFNSFKISLQFSLRNWFIFSPSCLSPLNKLANLMCSRLVSNSSPKRSVWMYCFPFFSTTLGLYFTTKSQLSNWRFASPSPWMGSRRIRPFIWIIKINFSFNHFQWQRISNNSIKSLPCIFQRWKFSGVLRTLRIC